MGGCPQGSRDYQEGSEPLAVQFIFSVQNRAGSASPSGALREACAGSVRKTIKCQTNRRLAEFFLPPGRQAGD